MNRSAQRCQFRTLRQQHVKAQSAAAIQAECVALAILAVPCLAPYKIIGSYCAVGSEIDPAPLNVQLRALGHMIALPIVTDVETPLRFARYNEGDALEAGPLGGILQPRHDAPCVRPDALLVPLLAVDARGYRLGQGAGYYDRTIAALKPIFTLGLAFECQLASRIDNQLWDEALHMIVTPMQLMTAHPQA
jgi:5-formyltetrahydrofolate cyclo-ligase